MRQLLGVAPKNCQIPRQQALTTSPGAGRHLPPLSFSGKLFGGFFGPKRTRGIK
jgi:hypothetical protein